jgi:hypothetical protein
MLPEDVVGRQGDRIVHSQKYHLTHKTPLCCNVDVVVTFRTKVLVGLLHGKLPIERSDKRISAEINLRQVAKSECAIFDRKDIGLALPRRDQIRQFETSRVLVVVDKSSRLLRPEIELVRLRQLDYPVRNFIAEVRNRKRARVLPTLNVYSFHALRPTHLKIERKLVFAKDRPIGEGCLGKETHSPFAGIVEQLEFDDSIFGIDEISVDLSPIDSAHLCLSQIKHSFLLGYFNLVKILISLYIILVLLPENADSEVTVALRTVLLYRLRTNRNCLKASHPQNSCVVILPIVYLLLRPLA